MVSSAATGSPTIRRSLTSKSAAMDENIKVGKETSVADDVDGPPSLKKTSTALSTASLVNQSCPKKMKLTHEPSTGSTPFEPGPMDNLLAALSEQQSMFKKQNDAFRASSEQLSSSSSLPITPAADTFGGSAGPSTRPASAAINDDATPTGNEVMRLKIELAQAKSKISRLEGMSQSGSVKSEFGHISPYEAEFPAGITSDPNSRVPSIAGLAPSGPPPMNREPWSAFDDARSETSDALSTTGFNRPGSIWGNNKPTPNLSAPDTIVPPMWQGRAAVNHGYMEPGMGFNSGSSEGYNRSDRLTPDYDMTIRPNNRRGSRYDGRFGPHSFGNQTPYGTSGYNYSHGPYDAGNTNMTGPSQFPMGMSPYSTHTPSTSLSPFAAEFTSASGNGSWRSEISTVGPPSHAPSNRSMMSTPSQHVASEGPTYMPTTEPLNYRRLLDRNVNCNWKYIVDKIVCNNDQQASIFLQQKLKVGSPEQKYEIVEAIILQAHPLMVNRFGNFLVQRCFEHGTPEQVINIAEAILGNTLSLSMDPFGCHVVQKAFDSVPEDYKALMVTELLRQIPETVIHRYACHVWQKLFELRWTESPPQIMKFVNEALRGMWHEVALGETGSLVVQNIFENCLEEDKRPCIEEVLANIDIVSHGQFGNWCIQHVCEHGAPADRSRAMDHVIRYAAEYSMDQYASKVVEKCLKIGGNDFLSRYLDRVCEGRRDRPRIPLIDIASDQYGNYLIQWILTQASPQHREIVAAHIRKHMVSLRGSKFGSRVGMLCTNHAVATRPGPGITPSMGRLPPGPRYNRPYQ